MNVVFATRRRHYDAQRDTLAFSSECPSCTLATHFWMTHMTALTDKRDEDTTSLFMLPATENRLNLSAISDILPNNTLQYCASTQDVFQSGNFTATRVMVKSSLDAMFSEFLPPGNSRSSLFKTVQDSLPSMDLEEPLMKLAASLRTGEPLDRLLMNSEPATPETAEALMRLVEKLINFLYIIPGEFRELDELLTELSKQLPSPRQSNHPDTTDEMEPATDLVAGPDEKSQDDTESGATADTTEEDTAPAGQQHAA